MITIGSLFSGIGGLERGLEIAGLGPVAWQAESDPYCRAVLARHYPHARRYERVEDVDERAPKIDLLCGGFPCQDLSVAGKRAGLDGARSGLWSEFVRIIRALRPGLVFVENVPELASVLGRVLGPLAELGFNAEWDVFSAAEVGAPHLRKRMFVLAFQPDALANPVSIRCTGRRSQEARPGSEASTGLTRASTSGCAGWYAEPDVGRVVDGAASRLDARRRRARVRCAGNGCVPQQAAAAFLTLAGRAGLLTRP